MSRYWASVKFGEHERGERGARGAVEGNSSLLSALQTSQVLNISTYAQQKHELIAKQTSYTQQDFVCNVMNQLLF